MLKERVRTSTTPPQRRFRLTRALLIAALAVTLPFISVPAQQQDTSNYLDPADVYGEQPVQKPAAGTSTAGQAGSWFDTVGDFFGRQNVAQPSQQVRTQPLADPAPATPASLPVVAPVTNIEPLVVTPTPDIVVDESSTETPEQEQEEEIVNSEDLVVPSQSRDARERGGQKAALADGPVPKASDAVDADTPVEASSLHDPIRPPAALMAAPSPAAVPAPAAVAATSVPPRPTLIRNDQINTIPVPQTYRLEPMTDPFESDILVESESGMLDDADMIGGDAASLFTRHDRRVDMFALDDHDESSWADDIARADRASSAGHRRTEDDMSGHVRRLDDVADMFFGVESSGNEPSSPIKMPRYRFARDGDNGAAGDLFSDSDSALTAADGREDLSAQADPDDLFADAPPSAVDPLRNPFLRRQLEDEDRRLTAERQRRLAEGLAFPTPRPEWDVLQKLQTQLQREKQHAGEIDPQLERLRRALVSDLKQDIMKDVRQEFPLIRKDDLTALKGYNIDVVERLETEMVNTPDGTVPLPVAQSVADDNTLSRNAVGTSDPNALMNYFEVATPYNTSTFYNDVGLVSPYVGPSAFEILRAQAQQPSWLSRAPQRVAQQYAQNSGQGGYAQNYRTNYQGGTYPDVPQLRTPTGYRVYQDTVSPPLAYPQMMRQQQNYVPQSSQMFPRYSPAGDAQRLPVFSLGMDPFSRVAQQRHLAMPHRQQSEINAPTSIVPQPNEAADSVMKVMHINSSYQVVPLQGEAYDAVGHDGSLDIEALQHLEQLEKELAFMSAQPVARLYFGDEDTGLDGDDMAVIRSVVDLYRDRQNMVQQILVEGHASERTRNMGFADREAVNYQISAQRANTVAQALHRAGVPATAIVEIARGSSMPEFIENTPRGEAWNRRVHLYFR